MIFAKIFAYPGAKPRRSWKQKTSAARQPSVSEIRKIIIYFHQSPYYTEHLYQHQRAEFPKLMSYEWFVIFMAGVLGSLRTYLKFGQMLLWLSFINSTARVR